jgi:hypothetical protein
MKLPELVKLALDELRMQMLGAQVLFGFQMQGAFQPGFVRLTDGAKVVDLLAFTLIVLTLGLLLAAPSQHRIVEQGSDTRRILITSAKFAQWSLLPFALALGCDFFVVTNNYWTGLGPFAAAGSAVLTALALWYGLGVALPALGIMERKPLPAETPSKIHEKIDHMLTEARVILPGAQALLGFQFIVTMTDAFTKLPTTVQTIHFVALAFVAFSVMLLISPAAVHRLAFRGEDSAQFHPIGSSLVTIALLPLAAGISADFYVTATKMTEGPSIAVAMGASAFCGLMFFWFALPLYIRMRRSGLHRGPGERQ